MTPRIRHFTVLTSFALCLSLPACDGDGSSTSTPQSVRNKALPALPNLVGKTFILDIPGSQWTEPAGLGDELAKVQPMFAFQVLAVDDASLTFTARIGAVRDGAQDPCDKTYLAQGALDSSDMTFTLGPADIQTLFMSHGTKTLATSHHLTISGQIIDGGAGLVAGKLAAELDAREIYPAFYLAQFAAGGELCAEMTAHGVSCHACSFEPDTSLCIDFAAQGFALSDSQDIALAEIPAFDPACL